MQPDPKYPAQEQILIVKGKGNKSRVVPIPNWVVEDVIAYINGERVEALKAGKISGKAARNALFLSCTNANDSGRPLKPRRLQQIMEAACVAIGLVEHHQITDPETGRTYIRTSSRYSVHQLRHTYATIVFYVETEILHNPAPYKKLQSVLGHSTLATTINTYLACFEIFAGQQYLVDLRRLIGL
jgi:site-specific recombinase XerD